jgi:hypothetical protein
VLLLFYILGKLEAIEVAVRNAQQFGLPPPLIPPPISA